MSDSSFGCSMSIYHNVGQQIRRYQRESLFEFKRKGAFKDRRISKSWDSSTLWVKVFQVFQMRVMFQINLLSASERRTVDGWDKGFGQGTLRSCQKNRAGNHSIVREYIRQSVSFIINYHQTILRKESVIVSITLYAQSTSVSQHQQ